MQLVGRQRSHWEPSLLLIFYYYLERRESKQYNRPLEALHWAFADSRDSGDTQRQWSHGSHLCHFPVQPLLLGMGDLIEIEADVSQVVIDHALPFDSCQLSALLEEISETGTIWSSCKRTGVPASSYLRARQVCKPLEKLHDAALAAYAEKLRLTLHRRGVEGVEKDIYFKGQVVGTERVYSDRLLELQLKRHDPSYSDKVNHSHQHAGGVLVVHVPTDPDGWHDKAKEVRRNVILEPEQ